MGCTRWSVIDVLIGPQSNITFHLIREKTAAEVFLFFRPVEHRGSCSISRFGNEWLHLHAAALLSSIHLQPVDYFGNKVPARPVSRCCCIDTFRLECFEGDKPGGRKKANQLHSWESMHIIFSTANALSPLTDAQYIPHIEYGEFILSLVTFQVLTAVPQPDLPVDC